jgi:hypothetical protein
MPGAPGWAAFAEPSDHVVELAWPNSIPVYEKMLTDGQIEALYTGTALPIEQRVWSLDPNGARDEVVQKASEDFGLPIRGQEDASVPRRPAGAFSFDSHLSETLLTLAYGHYYYEQVGTIVDGLWRLRKLAPRAPRTIDEIRVARDGGLVAVRQGAIGVGVAGAPVIPVERLVAYVWRPDARSRWIGRSMLRSLYRHWLVKDRLIRVDAINHERAGGVPVGIGAEGMSKAQIAEVGRLAQNFKVGEHGGAGLPHGADLKLVGTNASNVIASIRYHDEAMARAWMLMLLQLGQTESGSRALGGTFADYAALAVNAICNWFADLFTQHVIDDWVEWNWGGLERFAPKLHHREREREEGAPPTTDEFARLVEVGALTVDEEVEGWLRERRGLPALEAGSRPVPAPPPPVAAASRSQQRRRAGRVAAAAESEVSLPDRDLRRQPYEHEVRAAVDYARMEQIFVGAMEQAVDLYEQRVIPAQIAETRKAIAFTKTGAKRARVTQADMAKLTVPGMGLAELEAILLEAGTAGAAEAAAELIAQGQKVPPLKTDALKARVADQAAAITELASTGMTTAAQRKAVQLAGGNASAADVADGVVDHLTGLQHRWTLDQIQGAVTMAQNAGRILTFEQGAPKTATFYASELLEDGSTCDACMEIDGTEYETLDDAIADYPSGGFSDCAGGPRCRGSIIVVAGSEQDEAT